MDRNDVDSVLRSIFPVRSAPSRPPTANNWNDIRVYFGTEFPIEFISFMDLAGKYYIEGELLRVSDDGAVRGEDTIISVVEAEKGVSGWVSALVPFYSVGNGDYYCLAVEDGSVIYLNHENGTTEVLHRTFADFMRDELPDFA